MSNNSSLLFFKGEWIMAKHNSLSQSPRKNLIDGHWWKSSPVVIAGYKNFMDWGIFHINKFEKIFGYNSSSSKFLYIYLYILYRSNDSKKLTLLAWGRALYYPLVVFGLNFVGWIFMQTFQTFLEVKIDINRVTLKPFQPHWVS